MRCCGRQRLVRQRGPALGFRASQWFSWSFTPYPQANRPIPSPDSAPGLAAPMGRRTSGTSRGRVGATRHVICEVRRNHREISESRNLNCH